PAGAGAGNFAASPVENSASVLAMRPPRARLIAARRGAAELDRRPLRQERLAATRLRLAGTAPRAGGSRPVGIPIGAIIRSRFRPRQGQRPRLVAAGELPD